VATNAVISSYKPNFLSIGRKHLLQVFVGDNNVDQALRVLKKRLQREGVLRELKLKRFYEKPSERSTRERSEAIRRSRKLKRKQLQREGLLPAPKKKVSARGAAGRGGRATRPPRS
jgi:small subunit ribosomal protein S21